MVWGSVKNSMLDGVCEQGDVLSGGLAAKPESGELPELLQMTTP